MDFAIFLICLYMHTRAYLLFPIHDDIYMSAFAGTEAIILTRITAMLLQKPSGKVLPATPSPFLQPRSPQKVDHTPVLPSHSLPLLTVSTALAVSFGLLSSTPSPAGPSPDGCAFHSTYCDFLCALTPPLSNKPGVNKYPHVKQHSVSKWFCLTSSTQIKPQKLHTTYPNIFHG